jgi:hypothetical protein
VPPWVRVYRIQRDIPMPLVSSGVERGNLRELALVRMAALGLRCRDVRTREVGIQDIHRAVSGGGGGEGQEGREGKGAGGEGVRGRQGGRVKEGVCMQEGCDEAVDVACSRVERVAA